MSQPLHERARDRGVRSSAEFHEVAAKLDAALLRAEWEQEIASAPRRSAAGKRFLAERTRPPARIGSGGRAQEPLAYALWRHARDPERALPLPDGTTLRLVGVRVPLRSAAPDAARPDDPNRLAGDVDLLGVTDGGRLAIVRLAFVEADAARAGTGETPLRALFEAVACAAVAWAEREALTEEIGATAAATIGDEPPLVAVLGTARYWDLCRRRAPQKGARWIQQLERLAGELQAGIGLDVRFLRLDAPRDARTSLDADGWPALAEPPRLAPAWEESAGRVRPRAPSRPKPRREPAEVVVEADPSRPIRPYAMTSTYAAGDRVSHAVLGEGVVQGAAGTGKVKVRFGDEMRILVHGRG